MNLEHLRSLLWLWGNWSDPNPTLALKKENTLPGRGEVIDDRPARLRKFIKTWVWNFQIKISNLKLKILESLGGGSSAARVLPPARVVRNALASSQLFECNYKGLVQCIYSQRIKWDIMKVVILSGSPTDMYLDISRSKWVGEPDYFLSALLQNFSAAVFLSSSPPIKKKI